MEHIARKECHWRGSGRKCGTYIKQHHPLTSAHVLPIIAAVTLGTGFDDTDADADRYGDESVVTSAGKKGKKGKKSKKSKKGPIDYSSVDREDTDSMKIKKKKSKKQKSVDTSPEGSNVDREDTDLMKIKKKKTKKQKSADTSSEERLGTSAPTTFGTKLFKSSNAPVKQAAAPLLEGQKSSAISSHSGSRIPTYAVLCLVAAITLIASGKRYLKGTRVRTDYEYFEDATPVEEETDFTEDRMPLFNQQSGVLATWSL